jgi:hypothetical protein
MNDFTRALFHERETKHGPQGNNPRGVRSYLIHIVLIRFVDSFIIESPAEPVLRFVFYRVRRDGIILYPSDE